MSSPRGMLLALREEEGEDWGEEEVVVPAWEKGANVGVAFPNVGGTRLLALSDRPGACETHIHLHIT